MRPRSVPRRLPTNRLPQRQQPPPPNPSINAASVSGNSTTRKCPNILAIGGGFVAVLLDPELNSSPVVAMTLGVLVVALGGIGYSATVATEKAINKHIARARFTRQQIETVEAAAAAGGKFEPVARYYLALHCLVMVFGVLVIVWSVVS
ncbi:MAG: hypothetical protein AAF430_12330 [Myxococcota bacterium]